jgi:hypothetical protein
MVRWDHPPQRQREETGVEPTTAQVLGEGAGLLIPRLDEDSLLDLGRCNAPTLNIAR